MHKLTRNQQAERPPLETAEAFIVKLTAIVPTCGACNKLVKKKKKNCVSLCLLQEKELKIPSFFFFDFLQFFQLTVKQHKETGYADIQKKPLKA